MRLSIYAQKLTEKSAFVFWRVGVTKFGTVEVSFKEPMADLELAAELVAIHHLFFKQKVFNIIPASGKSFELNITKGAIKKLALGKSDKKHLHRYSKFLTESGRLSGININVKDSITPNPEDNAEVVSVYSKVDIEHRDFRIQEIVDTPAIGELVITEHAVERYIQYHRSGEIKSPWVSLINRLMNVDLKQINLSDKVSQHKKRKYGADNEVYIWGHDYSAHRYVVVKDHKTGQLVLTTVFKRESGA